MPWDPAGDGRLCEPPDRGCVQVLRADDASRCRRDGGRSAHGAGSPAAERPGPQRGGGSLVVRGAHAVRTPTCPGPASQGLAVHYQTCPAPVPVLPAMVCNREVQIGRGRHAATGRGGVRRAGAWRSWAAGTSCCGSWTWSWTRRRRTRRRAGRGLCPRRAWTWRMEPGALTRLATRMTCCSRPGRRGGGQSCSGALLTALSFAHSTCAANRAGARCMRVASSLGRALQQWPCLDLK